MRGAMRGVLALLMGCGLLLSWSTSGAREDQEEPQAFSDLCLPTPETPVEGTLSSYSAGATTLFLNFDGAFIFKVNASDAHGNLSFLCGGSLPPFDESPFGESRHLIIRQIATRVATLFADFNLEVVTRRPDAPPYDMALITDDAERCGYPEGLAGIGPIDCYNQLPGEISFIFAGKITDIDLLATVIAHEIGHSYGLLHSAEPCDVMSNFICLQGRKAFLDQQMSLTPDQKGFCGLEQINSWQLLMDLLGPRPAASDGTSGPTEHDLGVEVRDAGPTPDAPSPPHVTQAGGCRAAPRNAARQKEPLELGVALQVIFTHLLLLFLLPTLRIVQRKTRGD